MKGTSSEKNIVSGLKVVSEIAGKYSAAIFDMDGTILDSMKVWKSAGRNYLSSLGLKAEENLDKVLFDMNMSEGASYLKTHYGLKFSCEEIIDGINDGIIEAYRNRIQVKKGVVEVLQCLEDNGVKISLATSSDKCLVEACFKRLDILKYFDFILTCSEFSTSKSSPLIFEKARDFMKSSTEKTIVFEDALLPVTTAAKAGFDVAVIHDEESEGEKDRLKEIGKWYFDTWI